ncbi:hypothetical protein BB14905_21428 [Bacillus sp. B14905]|nr:hypothetical protein BB14905_21428 [Bacillus sp. B14905]
MNQEQLNAIKKRLAKTSVGPWIVVEEEFIQNVSSVIGAIHFSKDAHFIAHARKDVPALIEEVERLKRENEGLVIDRECAISNITNEFLNEEQRLRKALEKVMEVEQPIMEGWETLAYKIAQEALGGGAHE